MTSHEMRFTSQLGPDSQVVGSTPWQPKREGVANSFTDGPANLEAITLSACLDSSGREASWGYRILISGVAGDCSLKQRSGEYQSIPATIFDRTSDEFDVGGTPKSSFNNGHGAVAVLGLALSRGFTSLDLTLGFLLPRDKSR